MGFFIAAIGCRREIPYLWTMKVLSAIVVFVWTFVKMIVAGSYAVLLQLLGFIVGTIVKIAELTWGVTKFIGCMVLLLLLAGIGWLLLSLFSGVC